MSIGTLYYMPSSPRSNWFPALIKTLELDIKIVDYSTCENFSKEFPLHKVPAFLGSDGFKLTETIAITDYFISLVPNSTLFGSNTKEKVQVLRWLCFLNQDFTNAAVNIWKAKTDEDKKNYTEKAIELIKYIDSELASRKFLALDDKPTVADIFGFGALNMVLGVSGSDELKFPHIAKWKKNLIETQPTVQELSKK